MKFNKFILNLTSVFCFIYGALYCFTLVFIPVGIYCFIAGKLFSYKADHLLDNVTLNKKNMLGYTIFVSIACFPFGLLIIIAYFKLYGNNVKVENFEYQKVESESNPGELKKDETEDANKESEKVDNVTPEETEEEKLEKLEKLKKFREKNIISEEEFEMAKQQMFDKKDK